MKKILITGPIGSGKSEVSRILELKGYPVYDSDSRTKRLYSTVDGLSASIERELGVGMSGLGIIFSDREKREKLESIVYPLVRKDFEDFCASCNSPVVFLESATAWDKGCFKDLFDAVWLVTASPSIRAKRNPKALQRDAAQNFDGLRADITIINDSDISELRNKIDRIL